MKRLPIAIALALAGVLSLWAGFAGAHDGAHGPRILASVADATPDGRAVAIDLHLTGLEPGQVLHLSRLSADGALDMTLSPPVQIVFAEDVSVAAQLRFAAQPPGIFTLVLDFGADGQAGVVVIPVAGPAVQTHTSEDR